MKLSSLFIHHIVISLSIKFIKKRRFELIIQIYQKNEIYVKKFSVRIIARYYNLFRNILQNRIQNR